MKPRHFLGPCAVLLATAVFCAADPATQPANAMDAAKQYCAQVNQGHGYDAVKDTWDFDALFDTAFGKAMKNVSDADRAQMRSDMLELVGKVYSDPKLADAMAHATFTGFAERELRNHHELVSFTMTMPDGSKVPNSLEFARADDGWRIVNAGQNDQLLSTSLHDAFAQASRDETPLKFVHDLTASVNSQ